MKLIAGLGNPGKKYEKTRHNVGFRFIDAILNKYGHVSAQSKFDAEIYQASIGTHKVLLVKPMTYMNNSGIPLAGVKNFYKVDDSNIIVAYDEIDLAACKLRTKIGGGNAGHNGVKSVDAHLSKKYIKLRIGIGKDKDIPADCYVLANFTDEEERALNKSLKKMVDSLPVLLEGDTVNFLNKYNS